MDLNKENTKKIAFLIFYSFILLLVVVYIKNIAFFILNLIGLFAPLFIGGAIAFVLNILMSLIERLISQHFNIKKDLKRIISVIITYLLLFIFLSFIVLLIVPEISRSIISITKQMPEYYERVKNNNFIIDILNFLSVDTKSFSIANINWDETSKVIIDFFTNKSSTLFNSTLRFTSTLFGGVTTFLVSFVFSVYMLLQKEKLLSQLSRIGYAFIPKKYMIHVDEIASLSNKVFSSFVLGQLMEAIIIGLMCFIGMSIFKMPYATMISTLVGFTALIPVVGAFVGTAIGAFLILIINPMQAVWFVIFIVIIQQIDNNFIYPRVVGKSVGLPGIWVLAAVIIGGSGFGVMGMLFGVPLASIGYSILRKVVNYRLEQQSLKEKI